MKDENLKTELTLKERIEQLNNNIKQLEQYTKYLENSKLEELKNISFLTLIKRDFKKMAYRIKKIFKK